MCVCVYVHTHTHNKGIDMKGIKMSNYSKTNLHKGPEYLDDLYFHKSVQLGNISGYTRDIINTTC